MNAKIVHTMHDEVIVDAKAEIPKTVAGIEEIWEVSLGFH
jgi:hypothetical protein